MRGDANYNLQILIISIKSTAALFICTIHYIYTIDASVTTTSLFYIDTQIFL